MGYVFMAVGLLATSVPLFAFIVGVQYEDEEPTYLQGSARTALVICGLVALGAPAVGELLLSFQRRTALFLRRFRHGEPTRALGFTIDGAIGRSWRLVTLDDSEILPIGIRRAHVERRCSCN